MSGAKWAEKIFSGKGAGGWAILAACALLCALLLYEKDGGKESKTDTEIRMQRVFEKITGAGKTDIMIMEDGGAISGVLIVSEGAGDIAVRLRLQKNRDYRLNHAVHFGSLQNDN